MWLFSSLRTRKQNQIRDGTKTDVKRNYSKFFKPVLLSKKCKITLNKKVREVRSAEETLLRGLCLSLASFSISCKSRITWNGTKCSGSKNDARNSYKPVQGNAWPNGPRERLILLTRPARIYQQRQSLMKTQITLHRSSHWPVTGNNVLVSWVQVGLIVKDAEDSLCSLVLVFNKPHKMGTT